MGLGGGRGVKTCGRAVEISHSGQHKREGICMAMTGTSPLPHPHPLQAGLVLCVLVSAMALSLPFTLAVWPVQAYRCAGRGMHGRMGLHAVCGAELS